MDYLAYLRFYPGYFVEVSEAMHPILALPGIFFSCQPVFLKNILYIDTWQELLLFTAAYSLDGTSRAERKGYYGTLG